jgi:hypothetical protein
VGALLARLFGPTQSGSVMMRWPSLSSPSARALAARRARGDADKGAFDLPRVGAGKNRRVLSRDDAEQSCRSGSRHSAPLT